ncbi:MAG: hypothetical protein IJT29_03430 [Oscillospiraceae bacterium]|nr:hypothetical protein [Oscillospiraceae bacterium]
MAAHEPFSRKRGWRSVLSSANIDFSDRDLSSAFVKSGALGCFAAEQFAGGGMLVKSTKTTGMTTRFVVRSIMVYYINLFVQLKQVKRHIKTGDTV